MVKWTEHDLAQFKARRAGHDPATDQTADVEHRPGKPDAKADADEVADQTNRYIVCIDSSTVGSPDPDGLYIKPALDGLVAAGVLADDDRKSVAAVIVHQQTAENKASEATQIQVYEAPDWFPPADCWLILAAAKPFITDA